MTDKEWKDYMKKARGFRLDSFKVMCVSGAGGLAGIFIWLFSLYKVNSILELMNLKLVFTIMCLIITVYAATFKPIKEVEGKKTYFGRVVERTEPSGRSYKFVYDAYTENEESYKIEARAKRDLEEDDTMYYEEDRLQIGKVLYSKSDVLHLKKSSYDPEIHNGLLKVNRELR